MRKYILMLLTVLSVAFFFASCSAPPYDTINLFARNTRNEEITVTVSVGIEHYTPTPLYSNQTIPAGATKEFTISGNGNNYIVDFYVTSNPDINGTKRCPGQGCLVIFS